MAAYGHKEELNNVVLRRTTPGVDKKCCHLTASGQPRLCSLLQTSNGLNHWTLNT